MYVNVWNWMFSFEKHFTFITINHMPTWQKKRLLALAPSLSQCNASFIDETIVAILIISTHHYKVNTYIQLLGNRDFIYSIMKEMSGNNREFK